MTEPHVISLMGPTASGKTALSIELAKALNGEIVSVDSALIYRGMDIGTAKPSNAERQGIEHWLINTHDPTESYSVSAFFDDAVKAVKDIHQRNKIPILTGGTMMYFNALVNGIARLPEAVPSLRVDLECQAKERGWHSMHAELCDVDEAASKKIHPNDPQRILRALEVYHSSGKPISWWQSQPPRKAPFHCRQFAIAPEQRDVLHSRIAQRFDIMLEQGLLAEVEKLFQRSDLHQDLPSIRSVGYRQVWSYLKKQIDYTEMRERGIIATRQLAKRQLTWLRGWRDLTWLDTFDASKCEKIIAIIGR